MKKFLLPIILISSYVSAQAPAGYYNGTTGLTGYALKTKLHDIISEKNTVWNYSDLPNLYNQTDLDVYYDHTPANNTTFLLDIYSEIPSGPDVYEYTSAQMSGGGATAEGGGYNREHMMPQSTFYSNYPMYSDLFHVIPVDAFINQTRKNYPYGISNATVYNVFTNSSKMGNSGIPNWVYTGRVYEPIDEFKGDIARTLLYFAVRYEGKLGTFNYNNSANPASDTNPLDGTEERAFEPGYIAMLLQWNQQDPVSQREIDRNNKVYSIQKNRNPFIDNPGWVNEIWNQTPDAIAPQSVSNFTSLQTSAYFTTLSWSPSPDADVIGYKIYQNGTLIATTKGTFIHLDHLNPSTTYNFTVKAYDNGYLLSPSSNTVSVTTLASDIYAKDLYISKYLKGSSNNKGLEITNKTGHPVNLSDYRLSIQYPSGTSYYFPSPYELEGTIGNNETFVVLHPSANFSCFTVNQAKFLMTAPQMTFTGSQYMELSYKSTTIDALGVKSQNNSSALNNISLYRKGSINQPTNTFNINEWDSYPANYCQSLGTTLSTSELITSHTKGYTIYPNPVDDQLFVEGEIGNIKTVQIIDLSGKVIYTEKDPFINKKSIYVQGIPVGMYLLRLDDKVQPFIKR